MGGGSRALFTVATETSPQTLGGAWRGAWPERREAAAEVPSDSGILVGAQVPAQPAPWAAGEAAAPGQGAWRWYSGFEEFPLPEPVTDIGF